MLASRGMSKRYQFSSLRRVLVAAAGTAALLATQAANAQIKQPGAHPDYSVELEPHFVLDWARHYGWSRNEAIGLGLRATIPFLDNGPISSINNNMGIGFGLDWTHNGSACDRYPWRRERDWRYDCTVDNFHFPVVVQWNFWLTPIVSVFGEAGLDVVHTRWSWEFCDNWDSRWGSCDGSDTDVNFAFWGGGRFLFGANSNVGGVVRLGWPYISLGIGILI
jgi:hypothetical protein